MAQIDLSRMYADIHEANVEIIREIDAGESSDPTGLYRAHASYEVTEAWAKLSGREVPDA